MVDAEEAAAGERDVPCRLLGEHRGGRRAPGLRGRPASCTPRVRRSLWSWTRPVPWSLWLGVSPGEAATLRRAGTEAVFLVEVGGGEAGGAGPARAAQSWARGTAAPSRRALEPRPLPGAFRGPETPPLDPESHPGPGISAPRPHPRHRNPAPAQWSNETTPPDLIPRPWTWSPGLGPRGPHWSRDPTPPRRSTLARDLVLGSETTRGEGPGVWATAAPSLGGPPTILTWDTEEPPRVRDPQDPPTCLQPDPQTSAAMRITHPHDFRASACRRPTPDIGPQPCPPRPPFLGTNPGPTSVRRGLLRLWGLPGFDSGPARPR